MESARSSPTGGLRETVLDDLRRRNLKRGLKQDFRDLYRFYFNEDERSRLAAMGKVKRGVFTVWWLLKALLLNLSPVRRLLVILSLVLALISGSDFQVGDMHFGVDLTGIAFVILLAVLMLELRDKLLARNELEVGRAVQLALLPDRNPDLPGWDIWLYTRPANDVGGDLVDTIELEPGRLGVVLGDVSGKGLGAALLMSKLQATVRALATETLSLRELGRRMNSIFCRDQVSGRFATMVYLEVEADRDRVRVMNAGHMPPVLLTDRDLSSLDPVAPPLGILPEADFLEQEIAVPRGGLLLVYSDGVTEAEAKAEGEVRAMYGEERLNALMPELRGLDAGAAGKRILRDVEAFVGEERLSDDLSLVLLRRR
jgi:sigma-B regulation protein RsbU (phosphoserine phosphatase)